MMNMVNMVALNPVDGRKSFYGKANVIFDNEGNRWLKSYETIVAKADSEGKFFRFWAGYSATTMRHVNAFLAFVGIPGGGKKWWDAQEIVSRY